MKKGEVWFVDIPGIQGREQQGVRPVIILADLEANIVMIIPCTTKKTSLRFPNVIEMTPSKGNGLKEKSFLLVFQLRAIDKKRLIKKVGTIDNKLMSTIEKMIINMLKLTHE